MWPSSHLQNKIAFTVFKSQLEVYFPVFFLTPLPLKDFTLFIHWCVTLSNTIWPRVCEYLTVTSHPYMSLAQTVAATLEIVFYRIFLYAVALLKLSGPKHVPVWQWPRAQSKVYKVIVWQGWSGGTQVSCTEPWFQPYWTPLG